MSLEALGLDTRTGDVWFGAAPTTAAWDSLLQMFTFARPQGARAATVEEVTLVRDFVAKRLAAPPKAYQPVPKNDFTLRPGHILRTPIRLACPACMGETIEVPVVATAPTGIFEAWFGKGTCHCPACGASGTAAKARNHSIYEFTDLVQARLNAQGEILQRIGGEKP